MTVTAEMYRSRVADVLNLTTDNDRLRSELQRITDIAKASTTANSLPNIAKIASDALAGASVPAPQPPVEGLRDFVLSASFASRSADDSDTIFCEIYTPGYPPQKKGSFGFYVKDLRAILAALASPSLTAGVGSELRRAWLDKLNAIAPAVENLAGHQEQCDFDGVMVKVSRQALDEVLNAVNDLAVSFVTAPATLIEQSGQK